MMLKRTKGYLLLTLLVLTGLAGRIHSHTLSGKERRYLIQELRNSNSDMIQTVQDLTPKQLQFKMEKNKPCIRELVFMAASFESEVNMQLKDIMARPATKYEYNKPEDQSIDSLFQQAEYDPHKLVNFENHRFRKMEEAVDLLKKERSDLVRFTRTTTDDVRSFSLITKMGRMDLYQLLLLNTTYTKYINREIEKIKSSTRFPK